jgi:hypothetical protein
LPGFTSNCYPPDLHLQSRLEHGTWLRTILMGKRFAQNLHKEDIIIYIHIYATYLYIYIYIINGNRYLTLVMREMQIKTTMKCYSTPIRTKIEENTMHQGGHCNWNFHILLVALQHSTTTLENTWAICHTVKHTPAI